jgi:hypothetical protein
MEEKSIEAIVSIIEKKILFVLLEELPVVTCPLKKQRRQWKIEQIKSLLTDKLINDSAATK